MDAPARSPAVDITLVFEESRFSITSPDVLPSGDVITLEGDREYSTTVRGLLESTTTGHGVQRPVVRRTCGRGGPRLPVRLRHHSRGRTPGRGRTQAKVVPDGDYEATFTEFQGATIIDQISFLFSVGGRIDAHARHPDAEHATRSDGPTGPHDPPDPTDSPDGGGGGGGDGGR